MAESTFQRKAIYFLIATGIITIIILLLPIAENVLFQYVLTQLGLSVSTGRLVGGDVSHVTMFSQTTYDLVINVFPILKIIVWMAMVIVIIRFIGYLIITTAMRGSNQSEIGSLLRTVLSIIIYIVAFFIIFQSQYPGVQLAPLFTGSTIIGIVVGLALQDTLGNLFAGIALQADQPFQVGDVVSIPNQGTGVIEAVSWRGVKIRTFQSKLLVISNAVLGKSTIEVAPVNNLNARIVYFNSLYTNSPSKTAQAVREAVRHVENVSNKIRPVVRIRNLAESGIDWEVKVWLDDYKLYNDTEALIRQRIWYVFKREGIDFAFPTRTVHVEPRPEVPSVDEVVNETSEYLSRVPLFAPLSEEEIAKLARGSVKRIFAPEELIVRRGQEGRSMFVLVRGNVRVQIPEGTGFKTINRLATNDFFGEMGLLTGEPRTATVVADDEVEVLEIRKNALKPIFDGNPDLMASVCEIIDERRVLLKSTTDAADKAGDSTKQGVLALIKRFFGSKD